MNYQRINVSVPAKTAQVHYRTRQFDTHVNFEISLDGKHWFIAAELGTDGRLRTWGDKTVVTDLDFHDCVEDD